jgi:hypothetical protein
MQKLLSTFGGGKVFIRTPQIRFSVSKYVNLFYHVSVLFSEYFPDEISLGILKNSTYRQEHERLKTERLHKLFQSLQEQSFYTWDFMGLPLSETNDMMSAKGILVDTSQKIAQIWLEIYQEALNTYEDIWAQTGPKLKNFASEFGAQWISVSESILTKMSSMTKLSWKEGYMNVHFVDCIRGGSAWVKDIALPPFPNMDVEKKLLAHELAHTLVPDYLLKGKLQKVGLDWTIAHTAVDLIAYFSIKEYVTEPEKRGIKPNPSYYAHVEELYPIFEECYLQPENFPDFETVLKQIKLPDNS